MYRSALHPPRSRRKLLSAADEQRLALKIEAGRAAAQRKQLRQTAPGDDALISEGKAARTTFIESNIGLAIDMATKMRAPAHVDRDDMIQDGMLGLEKALEKFDWRKGYKFSTYATWWIRQTIQRGLEQSTSVRIPVHRSQELHGALAEADGDHRRLPANLAHTAAIANALSLDQPMIADGGPLSEIVPGDAASPEALLEHAELSATVERLLEDLRPSTRHAIVRRFGLDGSDPATYQEIGDDLGIGAEGVRRRVLRALGQLRAPAKALAA